MLNYLDVKILSCDTPDMDHVDKIVAQWNRERPDLNVGPMELIGRFKRITQHLGGEMEKTFARHGLNAASFDMLATLRRSGAPYQLSPGDLIDTMMVTSGTMTNRIDQVEKAGLVARVKNPNDGRSVLIRLTDAGLARINAAIDDHVATQTRLTAGLSDQQAAVLNGMLRHFLGTLE